MYRPMFRFWIATYFCGLQFVLGDGGHVSFLRMPAHEKELILSFLHHDAAQGIPDDFVCGDSTLDDRVMLCGSVIMLLKRLTPQQFNDLAPVSFYYKKKHFQCLKKDIVYQHLEKDTLKNVPMFFCSKTFIYFNVGQQYAITTNFYIKQGRGPKELLVFLDLPFGRKSNTYEPLVNSVKLWNVVKLYTRNEMVVDEEQTFSSYERQLSNKLSTNLVVSDNVIYDIQEEKRKLSKQNSQPLLRQIEAQLDIRYVGFSSESDSKSLPVAEQEE